MHTVILTCCHVGSRETNLTALHDFLKYLCQRNIRRLILAGDFFDLWEASAANIRNTYPGIVDRLMDLRAKGVKIEYLLGNHDSEYLSDPVIGSDVPVVPAAEIVAPHGKIAVIHGHEFDKFYKRYYFIYRILYSIRRVVSAVFGEFLPKKGLSAYQGTESYSRAAQRIHSKAQATYGKMAFVGLVMGHTHVPEHRRIRSSSIEFVNAGDWLRNNTFAAFYEGGSLRLLHWNGLRPVQLEPI